MKPIDVSSYARAAIRELLARASGSSTGDMDSVRTICRDVKERGDEAVREYSRRFDSVSVEEFVVPRSYLESSLAEISSELRQALETAAANIRAFHAAQMQSSAKVETMPGVVCWREARPIDAVGLYVPAGSAPLPSTALMLGVPATLAGCRRIVLCSPPKRDGRIDRTVAAVAAFLGITEVYAVGGVQAIAALAYGTKSIERVDKIFGPGNRFVAAAKQLVSIDPNGCAIDMLAGPSEVLVIADETADARAVAWDLLSQAEHDADAQAVLVTTSGVLANGVANELKDASERGGRYAVVRQSLEHVKLLVVQTLDEAMNISNDYAPEHLLINTRNALPLASDVRNAGSVFIGSWSPVAVGDYASGTNHTLPTNGTARSTGGLSLASFQKHVTFQSLSRDGLSAIAPAVVTLAEAEGLPAHATSVLFRLDIAS
ncbi:MAG: histidinol dehydrogenase [Bacteroidetes bacterium]|nr:histidinol dehydrogenase [Bacteroidota bacterium]